MTHRKATAPRVVLTILAACLAAALAAPAARRKDRTSGPLSSSFASTAQPTTVEFPTVDGGKDAYATLLFGGTPKQVDITRVLIRSLKRHGTTRPIVVMVTPEVPRAVRETLRADQAIVREVEPLTAKDTLFARISLAFTKLRAWTLTEYERVVFLDADMLPVENLDSLFEREACPADLCAVRNPDFTGNLQKYALNSAIFVLRPDASVHQDMLQNLDHYPGDEHIELYAEQGFFNAYVANITAAQQKNGYTFSSLHQRYDSCGMNDLQVDFDVAVHHPCAFIRRWKPGPVRLIKVSDPPDLVPDPTSRSKHDVPYMIDPHLPSQVWAWEPAAREVMAVDRPAFEMQRIFSTAYAEANRCFKYGNATGCESREAQNAGCMWCAERCSDSRTYCDAMEEYMSNQNIEHKYFWPPAQLLYQPLREGDNVYNATYHWPSLRIARRRTKYCDYLASGGDADTGNARTMPPQLDMPSFPANAIKKGIEMQRTVSKASKDVKCEVCKMLVREVTEGVFREKKGEVVARGLQMGMINLVSELFDEEGQKAPSVDMLNLINASDIMPIIHRRCYGLGVGGEGPRSTAARNFAILPSPSSGEGVGKRFVLGRKTLPKPVRDTLDHVRSEDEWLRDIFVTNNFEYSSLASSCRAVLNSASESDFVAAVNIALTAKFAKPTEKAKNAPHKIAKSAEKRACSEACGAKLFDSKPPPEYLKDETKRPALWDKHHVKNVGCLRLNEGYWSYEVCYGGAATQFHHEGHRVVKTVEWGTHDKQATMKYIQKTFESGQLRKLDRRYLSEKDNDVYFIPQVFSGGAPCGEDIWAKLASDNDSAERLVIVQWACAQDGVERLVVSDVRPYKGGCLAGVVGFTRSLCDDPRFAPLEKEEGKGANPVLHAIQKHITGSVDGVATGGDRVEGFLLDGGGDFNRKHTEEHLASGRIVSEIRRLRSGHGYCGERVIDLPAVEPAAVAMAAQGVQRERVSKKDTLKEWLEKHMLSQYEVALRENLGAKSVEDLFNMEADDWTELGVKKLDKIRATKALEAFRLEAAPGGCAGAVGDAERQCIATGNAENEGPGGWAYFGPVKPFPAIRRRIEIGGLLESEGMKVGAEIGVLAGDFAAHTLRRWHGCERYLMVDPWLHLDSAEYNLNIYQNEELMNRALDAARKANNKNAAIEVCRNFSTACAPMHPDGSFDYVYVDARHDYASAMEDIRAWWPKVRRGGILAGHDYVDAIEGGNSGMDWAVQVDGSRDHLGRAVQGAVDDFAAEVNRQVFVVYEERHDNMDILKDYPNHPSWLIRK